MTGQDYLSLDTGMVSEILKWWGDLELQLIITYISRFKSWKDGVG